MRVTLTARGGLAAAINLHRPPRVVDTGTLPAEQARELSRLVDAAAAARPQPAGPGAARDAMTYTIAVQRTGATTVLTGSDTSAPPEFAELLAWLERHVG